MKCNNKPWSVPGCSEAAVADLAEQQRLRLFSPRKGFIDAIEASTDPALLNYRLISQWLGASIPGIGFEGKSDLIKEMRALAE